MQPEFPEYVTNPEVVRELMKEFIVSKYYPLFKFPFLCVGNITDLSKMLYLSNKGTIGAMSKTRIFPEDVVNQGSSFEKDVKNVYDMMAWNLKTEVCDKFFKEIKESSKISKNSEKLKEISSKFIKWSQIGSNGKKNIEEICDAIKEDSGYRVDVIFMNETNYFEFWDTAETSDIDMERTQSIRSVCEYATYLKDACVWLIGVDDVIPKGSLVGVCSWKGEPVVEILYGADPDFGNGNTGTEDSQMLKDNIPLCINIFKGENFNDVKRSGSFIPLFESERDKKASKESIENKINIIAWLDFVVHVKRPNGVFYLEDVI